MLEYPDDLTRQNAALRLLSHATTVESVLGDKISWDAAAHAFIDGFQTALDLELVEDELTIAEIKRVEQLLQEKYNHPAWLERI